jgi:cyclohexa-1,5-dienecarbonyl-CoA hydratase
VRLAQEGALATIALCRPPVNVITGAMLEEILAALERAGGAKVVVLRGEGRCFSAGMDVAEHLPGEVEKLLPKLRKLAGALADVPVPTVAYLHGAAMGGGLELALACDLVYAAPGTKLGQPEIALGVMAPVATAWLPTQIGVRRTNDLLLTGRTIPPEQARDWGLINDVVDEAGFKAAVDGLMQKSRPALVATKKAIAHGRCDRFKGSLREAVEIYLEQLMKAEDPVEGLRAFLEKRAPRFADR